MAPLPAEFLLFLLLCTNLFIFIPGNSMTSGQIKTKRVTIKSIGSHYQNIHVHTRQPITYKHTSCTLVTTKFHYFCMSIIHFPLPNYEKSLTFVEVHFPRFKNLEKYPLYMHLEKSYAFTNFQDFSTSQEVLGTLQNKGVEKLKKYCKTLQTSQ